MATLTIADLDNGKRDLQTVDEVANSRADTATTRFGQQTTTLYEAIRRINAAGDEILSNLGFRVPVPYASGLNVTDSRFTVTGPDGKVYAPLSAPFTTGAWDYSQWYVLQNDLNDHKLLIFDTLIAAEAAAATLPDGQPVVADDQQTEYRVQVGALSSPRDLPLKHLAKPEGSGSVGFSQGGAGAVDTTVEEVLRKTLRPSEFASIAQAIAVAKAGNRRVLLQEDSLIRIPTDAATLQDAFSYTASDGRAIVTVRIQSGHALTHGLKLQNGDWSQYRIESEDPIAYLATGFIGVGVESTMPLSLIAGNNAKMPLLACLIQADDKAQAGYLCYGGSAGRVAKDCGVTYAAAFGLYILNESSCHAPAANFSFAGLGNRVTTNSSLEAEGINCSNTQNRGWPDPNNDRCGLDISRGSIVNIKSQGTNITNLSGSAGNALSVRRSLVSAEGVNGASSAKTGLRVEAGAVVSAGSSNFSASGDYGLLASNAATVDVQGCNLSGCANYAIFATRSSKVSANQADCRNTTGTGRAVYATDGAEIDASQVNASGALAVGFFALHGGKINARNATCDMSGSGAGSYAVFADYGSEVNASLGTFSNSTSGQDLRCTRGSTISASGATGTPSKTVNVLDVNGVIYR